MDWAIKLTIAFIAINIAFLNERSDWQIEESSFYIQGGRFKLEQASFLTSFFQMQPNIFLYELLINIK